MDRQSFEVVLGPDLWCDPLVRDVGEKDAVIVNTHVRGVVPREIPERSYAVGELFRFNDIIAKFSVYDVEFLGLAGAPVRRGFEVEPPVVWYLDARLLLGQRDAIVNRDDAVTKVRNRLDDFHPTLRVNGALEPGSFEKNLDVGLGDLHVLFYSRKAGLTKKGSRHRLPLLSAEETRVFTEGADDGLRFFFQILPGFKDEVLVVTPGLEVFEILVATATDVGRRS